MRMHNSAAAAFAALGALLTPVLAQQTTMSIWTPFTPPEYAEEFYEQVEAIIETVTNQETVVAMRCKDPSRTECLTMTFTTGPSTFRYSPIHTETGLGYGLVVELIDCTLTGSPTATTGTCTGIHTSATGSDRTGFVVTTNTAELQSTDLKFYPIALATPLPEADSTQRDSQTAAGTTPSATGGKSTETGANSPATENLGWKVAASWPGVAAVAALGLFI